MDACRKLSPQRNLRPNCLLTKVAEMARRHPSLQSRDLCQVHQELLKLFCCAGIQVEVGGKHGIPARGNDEDREVASQVGTDLGRMAGEGEGAE
ncbi:hypothetical protein J1605_023034 [Eschrichtius robustus]|uniref:Uncharacterized protein n=1 Tax=Eschrichtius robustus TaxID=9764 RepID=A0AB34H6R3_ESCRO|nr:hypothetical protein J1605_023034 [Eschrichtius robustus]